MIRFNDTLNFTRVYKYIGENYAPYIKVVDKAFDLKNYLTPVETISYIAENIGDSLSNQHKIAEYLYINCVDREIY